MIRFFVLAFLLTGLWWWLIGNRANQEPDAPVQWTTLIEEARQLGQSTGANQCFNESLLKTRICQSGELRCSNDIAIYASACLEEAKDFHDWCVMLRNSIPEPLATGPEQVCRMKGVDSSACHAVVDHILDTCIALGPKAAPRQH